MRAVIAFSGIILLAACSGTDNDQGNGQLEQAEDAIRAYGCGTCHVIPGVTGANGRVGPTLARMGRRGYIAGVLPNTRENMVRWIRSPESVDPRTAMPNTGVTEDDANFIADYLYTLE